MQGRAGEGGGGARAEAQAAPDPSFEYSSDAQFKLAVVFHTYKYGSCRGGLAPSRANTRNCAAAAVPHTGGRPQPLARGGDDRRPRGPPHWSPPLTRAGVCKLLPA